MAPNGQPNGSATAKVALITGGASGMGLAVATALAKGGGWHLHLLDMNVERGEEAAKSLGLNTRFHQANVTEYASLASIFDHIFKSEGRMDVVFANAGIVERDNFYLEHPPDGPPPEPNQLSIDINLKAVVTTSYLAQHYFRQSVGNGKDANLIMTASCGGIYPSAFSPMYSASKHGVVGWMRSIAKHYYHYDGIRVNAICPGTVRTNLLDASGWAAFPDEFFTPVEKIVEVVVMLVEGGDMVDTKGVHIAADKVWGRAVEINGRNHYFREMPEYCDDQMRQVMVATDVDGLALKKVMDK